MSNFQRPVNGFITTLTTAHVAADGNLVLASGDGAKLGTLTANQIYRVTATIGGVIQAIFEGTGLSTDTITGVTAVEGYSDLNLAVGTAISCRPTAKTFSDIQGVLPQTGYTTAQFDKTTNTTPSDVTGMSVNVNAGAKLGFRAIFYVTADATGGMTIGLGGTATMTGIRWSAEITDFTAGSVTPAGAPAVALATTFTKAGNTSYMVVITGTCQVNAAGTFTVQFAQKVSNGTSSVLQGAFWKVEPAG